MTLFERERGVLAANFLHSIRHNKHYATRYSNPLGGFFTINWARQHRHYHQTGHGQLADLFAKILPEVFSGLGFLASCMILVGWSQILVYSFLDEHSFACKLVHKRQFVSCWY